MIQVIKRDDTICDFCIYKISEAITQAFHATNTSFDDTIIYLLSLQVTAKFQKDIHDNQIHVEKIQDCVEHVLEQSGYTDVAKAYILYRNNREKIRNMKSTILDYKKLVDSYVKEEDWRVKENSTVTYSIGGLILHNSGSITANYWLSELYDQEIANAHRNADIHIHDLSMLTGYCAGWSLKQLIQEGLGGIAGRITSSPAKHLSTLCNQMVNFMGIMQNEWAGAQAFSSFDTYLAPFVRVDNLTYDEVKQCIQSFIYGVNIPSRWGCVDEETEVLSVNGFKKYNELHEGELIYTWNNGMLELNKVNKVVIKQFKGKLHSYRKRNYNQTVTPNHRCLTKDHNIDSYRIRLSEEIFDAKTAYSFPVKFKGSRLIGSSMNDITIILAAMLYTDGSLDFRNESIHKVIITKSSNRWSHELIKVICNVLDLKYSIKQYKSTGSFGEAIRYIFYGKYARKLCSIIDYNRRDIANKFLTLTTHQAKLFLSIWSGFDGDLDKVLLQYDNNKIKDKLQQIAILAGYTSYKRTRGVTNYIKIRKSDNVIPSERCEVDYDGIVWCPNVDNGTAVFRKDGNTYISGQSQSPFTNITLDWTVPDDLSELPCIVGNEEMDFCYKDCKQEMDMINKAFIEIMIEGDANGRGFQYPIPTYSITKDFDWSNTENNRLLFEMTAKYGTPYFSNYINSDMEPGDVRSMCCRLRLDLRELRRKTGGFFGSGESTGSVGVVTINMPRIAYLAKTETEFFKRLDHIMDLVARSLKVKRDTISKLLDEGMYPYTKRYLGTFDNHFSTIGLIGMNEVGLNAVWLKENMISEKTQAFTKKTLNHMRERDCRIIRRNMATYIIWKQHQPNLPVIVWQNTIGIIGMILLQRG